MKIHKTWYKHLTFHTLVSMFVNSEKMQNRQRLAVASSSPRPKDSESTKQLGVTACGNQHQF